ncbi:MAG: hypothetical protein H8E28_02635 [Anaerolineae bacterium]|nr:hypothetical protein [Anaerolineae bacterium]
MKRSRGQILIVVAVLLLVVLFFLAVITDGARLMVEKHELNRGADAAARAGLVIVGDQMVTQVVYAQTMAAVHRCTPPPEPETHEPEDYDPHPTCTPTPQPSDFYAWLKDRHRATLVSSGMKTKVAVEVYAYADSNGLGLSNPAVEEIEVIYPYEYHPNGRDLNILVRIRRQVTVIFMGLLGMEEGKLYGETQQSIPQRK